MKTLETTAVVADDRRLILELPQDVLPGQHRFVVLIDPTSTQEREQAGERPTPTRWDGDVLVYDGTLVGPVENAVDDAREERIRQIISEIQS